jgi:catechol-2,3-dioxygenase
MNNSRFKALDNQRAGHRFSPRRSRDDSRLRGLRQNDDATLATESRILRLGHVHIKVRHLDRSVPFYTDLLGLKLTEQVGRYAFLAVGEEHHSVALEEIGDWATRPSPRTLRVTHIAFEVSDRTAFLAKQTLLREKNIPFISSNNGTNWSLDVKDPDGHQIQIFLDRRHAQHGAQLWQGRWYGPLTC